MSTLKASIADLSHLSVDQLTHLKEELPSRTVASDRAPRRLWLPVGLFLLAGVGLVTLVRSGRLS